MASKQHRRVQSAKRIATLGAAAATVTALVAAGTPLPPANAATTVGSAGLPAMALAPGAIDPASIPDLTFGFGGRTYDSFQSLGAALESALLNNVNLAGLLERLGYDPETAINTALGNALTQLLAGVTVDVGSIPVLGPILNSAGITNAGALLDLLGFDLADPFNLSGAATPGLNIITAGPPFSLLKFLGIDLGWVPGFPNSVADEINATPYLGISPLAVLKAIPTDHLTFLQKTTLAGLITTVDGILGDANAVDVRVPVVIGFGLGAFAAGMAYSQVVADLANQPGGANNVGADPLAGSITILPLILLRNPGRANGGLFARGYPLAGLVGIDTVTPDTAVSSSSDGTGLNIPVGTTGIVLGAANLIPIKVDATVEYDPLSDVPAWPNPVSLANSAAALLFPTYLLRGITAASLTQVVDGQLNPQLAAALANNGPLALNLYLTVPVNNALPLLEPIRLPIDVINLFTGANLNNPIATALEPALTTLVNLGYTDVKRTVVNGVPVYDRSLDQANVITPFGTLPSGIDWGQVPGDLLIQLAAGIQQAIAGGLVSSTPVVNPLAILANLLGVNGLPGAANTASPLSALTALPGLTTSAVNATAGAVVPAAQLQGPTPSTAKVLAAKGNDTDTDIDTDITPVGDTTPAATVAADTPAQPAAAATPVTTNTVTTNTGTPAKTAQARADAAAKKAADRLDKIAKDGMDQLNKIVKDGQDQIQKVLKDAHDNLEKSAKTATGADKPADKTADKPADKAAA
ncbi:MAG: hypothetical protein QOD90_158 [Mycobacterium sp.]|jgi:hypothetical protein|nr:hypothetical protein [Mycobacterium sp.]